MRCNTLRTVNSQSAGPETVLQFRFHISDRDEADKQVKTLRWNNGPENLMRIVLRLCRTYYNKEDTRSGNR